MAAPMTRRIIFFAKQLLSARYQIQNIRVASFSSDAGRTSTSQTNDKDPYPLYSSDEVQVILQRITGFDLMKVAGPRKTSLERPVYKLMTDDELSKVQEAARDRLLQRLEIPPPYMNPRAPVKEPLAVDADLAHFDTHKYVFSDISFGIKDRERSVVVREVDGTLRVAPWDMKERVNQLYNPREGRSIIKPQMFEEHNLERMISEQKFVYILERACAQFEPDDPDFLRVCHRVFSAVNTSKQFDTLRSTRFFAPLTFHLIWTKMADSLLVDMLTKNFESDAVDVVNLYCMIHPSGACAEALKNVDQSDTQSIIKTFLETEASSMASELELALQALVDQKTTKSPSSISSS